MCTFSDIEKDQKDTTFIYAFLYCDMDKGIIKEEPELLIEVIVTGIMAETITRTTYNSCKVVNLFVGEEAGQFYNKVVWVSSPSRFGSWCV